MNILQIGCSVGGDHVEDFLRHYKSCLKKVVLVDASEDGIKKAQERYSDLSRITFKNVAVVNNDSSVVEFFYPEHDSRCGHASLRQEHVALHEKVEAAQDSREPWKVKRQEVPAVRINNLLELFGNEVVDRLYIDVEGYDCQLIDDIDLNAFRIGYIKFEHVHSDGTFKAFGPIYQNSVKRLIDHGFGIVQQKEDTIALHMP